MSLFDSTPTDDPAMVQCRVMGQSNYGARKSWTDAEWMEWQSNYFSSVLLMPKEAVKKVAGKPIIEEKFSLAAFSMVSKVARTFNVSPEAAKYRLEAVGCLRQGLVHDVSFLSTGLNLLQT